LKKEGTNPISVGKGNPVGLCLNVLSTGSSICLPNSFC